MVRQSDAHIDLWLVHIHRLGFGGVSLWQQLYYVEISHCTDSDSDTNFPILYKNQSPESESESESACVNKP